MNEKLLAILTADYQVKGELAAALGEYFNREFSLEDADNIKKILCCSQISIDTFIAELESGTVISLNQWSAGNVAAAAAQNFIDVLAQTNTNNN